VGQGREGLLGRLVRQRGGKVIVTGKIKKGGKVVFPAPAGRTENLRGKKRERTFL